MLARGETYLKEKQFQKAIDDLTRYLNEHPGHCPALVSRAAARGQLGQFVLAVHDCDEALKQQVVTDPHSPAYYRVNGTIRNIPGWYDAWNVQPGDQLYVPPEQRVKIW